MTTHNFNQRQVLGQAWSKTKEHFWYLLGAGLVTIIVGSVIDSALPILGSIGMALATTTVALVIMHGHKPGYDDLLTGFKSWKIIWHFVVAEILYAIIVLLGLICFIFPGIYIAIRLRFFRFMIVEDENLGPIDALKKGWAMTRGKFWKLFWLTVVLLGINILGALLLLVGLLFTIPFTILAGAFLYKQMSATPHEETEKK